MSKKVDIKFKKSPSGAFGLAYHVGENASFDEKQAAELIDKGYAVLATESASDMPEDLPGRDAIIKAKISFEDLKKIDSVEKFQEINGVGKATAEKLVEYFKQ